MRPLFLFLLFSIIHFTASIESDIDPDRELLEASKLGLDTVIVYCLAKGGDIEIRDDKGFTYVCF